MVVVVSMMMVEQHQPVSAVLRIRHAVALPLYALALLLELVAAGLGRLAAMVARRRLAEIAICRI